jgi:hypothetical protein
MLGVAAWASCLLALSAAPIWGSERGLDPGAGAGPDIWDVNRPLTISVSIVLLLANLALAGLVWRSARRRNRLERRHRNAAETLGAVALGVVGVLAIPAYLILALFSLPI